MDTAMFVLAILALIASACCVISILLDEDDGFVASFVSLVVTVVGLAILVFVNFGQS